MGGVFMFIDKKIKEIEQIRRDLPKQAKVIANKFKAEILDYIRENQLFDLGIDGKGNKLLEYKPFTVSIKKQKGQPTNRTTLSDTGSFYDGFDLLFTNKNAIGVFSRDAKTPDLIDKYGADIFTFTVNNIEEIDTKIFEENLIKWILNTPTFTQI